MPPAGCEAAARRGLEDVAWPIASSGAALLAVLWAAAALVLPWLVRGRSLALDVVTAAAWAAALGGAGAGLAEHAVGPGATAPGLAGGAALAGALAVALPRLRRPRGIL
jgi:hypothetical protein